MIKDLPQAAKVQERRAKQGKRGYAKAVRRALRRIESDNYQELRGRLPVNW